MTMYDRLRKINQDLPEVPRPPTQHDIDDKLDAWRDNIVSLAAFMGGGSRGSVQGSEDLDRILALPRRPLLELDPDNIMVRAVVALMNRRLMLPGREPGKCSCKCASMGRRCITSLHAAQAWALYEAPLVGLGTEHVGGLLGAIAAGTGKTSLNFLMPLVVPGVSSAVALIPPNLKQQLLNEYLLWREHWRVPSLVVDLPGGNQPVRDQPVLHVIPYSQFSRPESTDLLTKLRPDLIVGDEIQRLRNANTARTGRFLRFVAQFPRTRFCGWTGTLTNKSLREYAHLSTIALREGSPLPLEPRVLEDWATAIDPSDSPADAGELRRLCEPHETLYEGFKRRLVETRGVVATPNNMVAAGLNFHERYAPAIPGALEKLLKPLREDWIRPDGEVLVDILDASKAIRQLICGFYYRWRFPRLERDPSGEPTPAARALVARWFAYCKQWRKELREKLKRREEHLDSEKLCTQAAIRFYRGRDDQGRQLAQPQARPRVMSEPDPDAEGAAPEALDDDDDLDDGRLYRGSKPTWKAEHWPAWRDIKDQVYHETEAVWVDEYLARDCAEWAKENLGVVWYEFTTFGERVGALAGLPVHRGGPRAEALILAERGDRSIVASIKSHGTGRDGLQRLFSRQIMPNPPSSGDGWEQLLARLHRLGQESDAVDTWVYRHVPEMVEALDKSLMHARYVAGTLVGNQRLLSCNCTFTTSGRLS